MAEWAMAIVLVLASVQVALRFALGRMVVALAAIVFVVAPLFAGFALTMNPPAGSEGDALFFYPLLFVFLIPGTLFLALVGGVLYHLRDNEAR